MKFLLLIIFVFFVLLLFYSINLIKNIIVSYNINVKKYWYVFFILLFFNFILIYKFNLFKIFMLFIIHFLILSIIIDFIYIIINKIYTKDLFKKNLLKKLHNTYLIPLFITIIIMIYGIININNIVKTNYTLYTKKDINSAKILLIGDVHYGEIFKRDKLNKIKKEFDKVNADIVILIGDIVDESTSKDDMKYIFKVLGNIKNNKGIYFVYGNHDRQKYLKNPSYSNFDIENTLINNNITILKDEYKILDNNIILLGRNDYKDSRKNINDILDNKINKDNNYIITLDHQPVKYNENNKNNIDLVLSGHTHAGQIFPIKYLIDIFNTADSSYGYKKYNNMDTIVTSGLVGWGFPIRTSKCSEYVVIDIKKG